MRWLSLLCPEHTKAGKGGKDSLEGAAFTLMADGEGWNDWDILFDNEVTINIVKNRNLLGKVAETGNVRLCGESASRRLTTYVLSVALVQEMCVIEYDHAKDVFIIKAAYGPELEFQQRENPYAYRAAKAAG